MLNRYLRRKAKKVAVQQSQEPRDLEAIKKEAGELTMAIGNETYIIELKQRDVADYKERLMKVNQEAAARLKLDAEKKAVEDKAKASEGASANESK